MEHFPQATLVRVTETVTREVLLDGSPSECVPPIVIRHHELSGGHCFEAYFSHARYIRRR